MDFGLLVGEVSRAEGKIEEARSEEGPTERAISVEAGRDAGFMRDGVGAITVTSAGAGVGVWGFETGARPISRSFSFARILASVSAVA